MSNKWLKAARLRTIPLSISGIVLASFIAKSQDIFSWDIFLLAMLTTIGFQVISNFANDYGDGVKGTDNEDRIGPMRAIQSGEIKPEEMKKAVKLTSIVTFVIAICLIIISFGVEYWFYSLVFIALGVLSILAAIKYTVGDKAYGYRGYGDVFVFIFFGLLSVCGTYFLYSKSLNISVVLPALSVGFLSVGVLNLNNMRDYESDKKSNKNTLVVKIGIEFAKYYHFYLIFSAFLFALLYNVIHMKSFYQFLFIIAFLPIFAHLKFVFQNKNLKDLDSQLKKLALSTFLFSVLFGIGLLF